MLKLDTYLESVTFKFVDEVVQPTREYSRSTNHPNTLLPSDSSKDPWHVHRMFMIHSM